MAAATHPDAHDGGWRREGSDLVRGVSGGLLFGVPLLYTMEVWWYGAWVDPRWMLGALGIAFLTVIVVNRGGGFRDARDVAWRDAALDGVEMVAIGLVCAAGVLVLLRQITGDTSLEDAAGATVFEAIPFAFGAALSGPLLARGSRAGDEDDGDAAAGDDDAAEEPVARGLADAGATAVGALVVSFSIAPTDEVPMVGQAVTAPWLLALVGASLLATYAIVFAADFADQEGRHRHEGLFQRPFPETAVSYVISLVVAGTMLAFFQRVGPDQSWETWLTYTLVLGLPAAIGGAAGRLAV